IWSQREVTVTRSTVSNNSANDGGGISNNDTVVIVTSTISANTATGDGGGIFLDGSGPLMSVISSTISGNSAGGGGGGIARRPSASAASITLRNSIVAGNTDQGNGSNPDFSPDSNVTAQFSLIGNNNGSGIPVPIGGPGPSGNLVGTSISPFDPKL